MMVVEVDVDCEGEIYRLSESRFFQPRFVGWKNLDKEMLSGTELLK